MSTNDEHKPFLPDNKIPNEQIVFEVPVAPKPPYQERIPSGYDPMGQIYLRGRAYRNLAVGKAPWWLLISSWIFFVIFALLALIVSITSSTFYLLGILIFNLLFVVILWRGTVVKVSAERRKRKI